MKFLILTLLFLSFSATAQEREVLAKAKELMISNIDERIATLQETKSCISSASTKDALNECRKKMHTQMKAFKDQKKQDRKELKATFEKLKKANEEKEKKKK